jgi:hypothetical protein
MNSRVADYPQATTASASAAPKRPLIRAADVGQMLQPVQHWVVQYPAAALASAFVVGVAIAWWIKRK